MTLDLAQMLTLTGVICNLLALLKHVVHFERRFTILEMRVDSLKETVAKLEESLSKLRDHD